MINLHFENVWSEVCIAHFRLQKLVGVLDQSICSYRACGSVCEMITKSSNAIDNCESTCFI